jgi:hypothetical protein
MSAPAGTTATPNTTILSAAYNAFVADLIADLNAARPVTAGGTGGTSVITGWDGLAAKGTDIASASSINLTTATGPSVTITGTATIASVTLAEGSFRIVRAGGAFTWDASASLLVNGSSTTDVTAAANDLFLVRGGASSVVSVVGLGSVSNTFATNAQAMQATSTTLSVNPANLANLYSIALNNAIEIADLKGSRLNMAGGIADAYDSETDVDTATSTNEAYDASNDLYSPSPTETTTTLNNQSSSGGFGNFTYIDRSASITNNISITKIGVYAATGKTIVVKIALENSSTNYDIVRSESLVHPGGGWADLTLSSPYAVAASGTFRLGAFFNGTSDNTTSVAQASIAGNSTGTGVAGWTTGSGGMFPMRYSYGAGVQNMTLVSNAFTATAVPTVARIATFIDPQESMTINTDFTAEASRDGGTTWTAATLALVSNPVGTVEQYEGTVSISSQPSGSSMKYRLKTLNNKDIDVTGTVFQWS